MKIDMFSSFDHGRSEVHSLESMSTGNGGERQRGDNGGQKESKKGEAGHC
jgi:hypothetical protein